VPVGPSMPPVFFGADFVTQEVRFLFHVDSIRWGGEVLKLLPPDVEDTLFGCKLPPPKFRVSLRSSRCLFFRARWLSVVCSVADNRVVLLNAQASLTSSFIFYFESSGCSAVLPGRCRRSCRPKRRIPAETPLFLPFA